MNTCIVIYRGPLERSRLAFIFETLATLFAKIKFLWLLPHPKFYNDENRRFDEFIKDFTDIEFSIIPSGLKEIVQVRKQIKAKYIAEDTPVFMVGLSTPFFIPQREFRKKIWFINGIPEEKLLHKNTQSVKIRAWLSWKLLEWFAKPDLIVTVSQRMSIYVSRNFPKTQFFAAPTCVDLTLFKKNEKSARKYFTYLGSGAPWQNLGLLSTIWQEIHKQDATIHFRVISRDSRTRVLSKGIKSDRIEFVGSEEFEKIAGFLSESLVGFLIRKNNLVNRVSFPTKLAEYLASGCWVVASDLDWDVSDLIDKFQVGYLVNPLSSPSSIASEILSKKREFTSNPTLERSIDQALEILQREYWIQKTKDILCEVLSDQ
jgi:glycosyltransferase involved in cell wall biosynthesis